MIVGRRRPDLAQCAGRHQALAADRVPERAADRAGFGPAIEDGADDLDLARTRVAMLADVGVEAQRAVVLPLDQALPGEKVNRQDRRVATVAAAEGERAVSQIGKPGNRAAAYRDDLRRPGEIGVAHGNRSASMAAPRV